MFLFALALGPTAKGQPQLLDSSPVQGPEHTLLASPAVT